MIFRSRAPLRISFAGGGTDLSPYADEYGGVVLSTTIDRYAYASLRACKDKVLRVRSLDLDTTIDLELDVPPAFDGNLDLIKGCLRRLHSQAPVDGGLELYLETEAPPESGLGASSALVVATLAALAKQQRLTLDRYELARLACRIEREDVSIPGGLQDQYAAAFGGFNLIEFKTATNVIVNPLRVDADILNELEYNMLLVYTGATRVSSRIIESQIASLTGKISAVTDAMDQMKALTVEAKDALLTGRLADFAAVLHEEWLAKKRTSESVTTPRIDEIYEEARRLGVLGGKVSGAGGGGFMFLFCPFDCKPAVTRRLVQLGGEVLPIAFETRGVQSWSWANPAEWSTREAVHKETSRNQSI